MRERITALTLAMLTFASGISVAKADVKKPISRYETSVKEKKKRKKNPIQISVTNMPLGDLMKMVSRITGISYVLENGIAGDKNQMQGELVQQGEKNTPKSDLYDVPVTVAYRGTSVVKLMQLVCKSADVYCERDFDGVWRIKPYEEYITNLPISFDFNVSGGGTLTAGGGNNNNAGGGSSAGGESSISYSYSDKNLIEQIRALLSEEGKLVRSESGYLAVLDKPSRIEKIKKVLLRQQIQSEPFRLNIKVVRVDKNKDNQAGIDWNYVLGDSGAVKISANFASPIDGGMSFAIDTTHVKNLIRLLRKVGDVKVVKQWTVTARGGHPLFFDDVEEVPWVTSSTVTTDTSTETAEEVNFASVGLKLRLIANAYDENITGDVYAEISDLLAIEQLTNSTRAPHSAASRVALSYSVPFNQSVIVSGLTARRWETATEGLPLISKIPIIGNLFKYQTKKEKNSEFIVILTPTPLQ